MGAGKTKRSRLDELVVRQGLAENLTVARALILAGVVFVEDQRSDKVGTRVSVQEKIQIRAPSNPYVSRGGLKLAHAIDVFGLEVTGAVCWDLGASTGGFTDCLLQRGALHVYAIDVGRGQLDWGLQRNDRVTQIEGVNVRYLDFDAVPECPEIITVDLSFISLRLVLPRLKELAPVRILALVKPQFEAYKEEIGVGGIVRGREVREAILERLKRDLGAQDISVKGRVDSPIRGQKGNQEYFFLCSFQS
jgi:23S rRNA (cytidine1920-2'-O)/16S rRNA (cytidine1409-2'-O)-methyltransferase